MERHQDNPRGFEPLANNLQVRDWRDMPSHLLAILHSLPMGSGVRTLRRVEIAQQALGCRSSSVVNVYPAILPDSNALNDESSPETFDRGRELIRQALDLEATSDVLLAYGIQLPTGASRHAYRAQIDWISGELASRSVRVWAFGGRPSHPSRWHRVVSREYPGSSVEARASEFLVRHDFRPELTGASKAIDTMMLSSERD